MSIAEREDLRLLLVNYRDEGWKCDFEFTNLGLEARNKH
jgi:hypothetical protein